MFLTRLTVPHLTKINTTKLYNNPEISKKTEKTDTLKMSKLPAHTDETLFGRDKSRKQESIIQDTGYRIMISTYGKYTYMLPAHTDVTLFGRDKSRKQESIIQDTGYRIKNSTNAQNAYMLPAHTDVTLFGGDKSRSQKTGVRKEVHFLRGGNTIRGAITIRRLFDIRYGSMKLYGAL